jgi:hypothetical protein
MLLAIKSLFTREFNFMELPITKEKLESWSNNKGNIQDIFPELTISQREFILTGITDKEWASKIGKDDE